MADIERRKNTVLKDLETLSKNYKVDYFVYINRAGMPLKVAASHSSLDISKFSQFKLQCHDLLIGVN